MVLIWKNRPDGKVSAVGKRGNWLVVQYYSKTGSTLDLLASLWALFFIPYGKESSSILEVTLQDLSAAQMFAQTKEEAMSRWSAPL